MTSSKAKVQITVATFIEEFLARDDTLSDEMVEMVSAAVAHGVLSGLNAVINGYELDDGTFQPVIATDLMTQSYAIVAAIFDEDDDSDEGPVDDIDEDGSDSESESGSESIDEVKDAQAQIDEQLDPTGNRPNTGWMGMTEISRKKAN
jgi:hypothetical protein